MFSYKELVVFAGSIGFGLSYMIFKLSYEMAKTMADQDVEAIRDFMLRYQVLVFLMYAALILVHLLMIYVSRRFVKDPVKENFTNSGWLVSASGTLWLFVAISLIMSLFDGFNFLAMWVLQTGEALKFSCFFYWFYRVFNDPVPELSQIAVLWQIPMIFLEIFIGLRAYKRYYDAKRLFTHLYPNIVRTGIYNAFASRSKNGDKVHIEVPQEIAEASEENFDASDNEIVPLKKNLGNNSLFSVDTLPKEKTILRTQAEIDAEYEAFFSEAPVPASSADIIPAAKLTGEDYEQELIPTEFDFSKMRLAPESKTKTAQDSENPEEKTACPLCGFLNGKDSAECEFCGAELQ